MVGSEIQGPKCKVDSAKNTHEKKGADKAFIIELQKMAKVAWASD